MHEYTLNIYDDGRRSQKLLVIQSGKQIDWRLLQIAGLVLSGGLTAEELQSQWPLAAMYASVEPQHTEDYVDQGLKR